MVVGNRLPFQSASLHITALYCCGSRQWTPGLHINALYYSGSRQSSSLSKRQGAGRGRGDNSEGTSSGKSTAQSSRGRTTETEAFSSSSAMASEDTEGDRTGGSEETPNPAAGIHIINENQLIDAMKNYSL